MYADDAAFVFPDSGTMRTGARKLRAFKCAVVAFLSRGQKSSKRVGGNRIQVRYDVFPGEAPTGRVQSRGGRNLE